MDVDSNQNNSALLVEKVSTNLKRSEFKNKMARRKEAKK